ncbi:hypothetical protein Tco_0609880, partial [Tanacetum coccineum]
MRNPPTATETSAPICTAISSLALNAAMRPGSTESLIMALLAGKNMAMVIESMKLQTKMVMA